MKNIPEKLWNEYFLEECAAIDTHEERTLTRELAELYDKANALLNEEQKAAIEKYVDALCDIDALFAKKAFCKGCEFAVSFLLEASVLKKPETIHGTKASIHG